MSVNPSKPIDTVRCVHNAFRRDAFEIDNSFFELARSGGDITPFFERLRLLGDILDYHAQGEEAAVFPAVDNRAPFVSRAYVIDHRELDGMVSGLDEIRKAPDLLVAARATAVLRAHLRIHLNKEDVHLYPILREGTTDEEQMSIGRVMASKIPQERFSAVVQWLFPLINLSDQVTVTNGWMAMMPPPVFTMAKQLIKKSVPDNWGKLMEQVPGLTE
jgi:hypothetical protein